jgi:hypothetical protein
MSAYAPEQSGFVPRGRVRISGEGSPCGAVFMVTGPEIAPASEEYFEIRSAA